jgi:hypothetical protein
MIRSRLGLKALGLCALVLGLMAFASSAQAEPLAKWAIVKANGELITISKEGDGKGKGDTLLPQVGIELETLASTGVKEAILLTSVGGVATEILCKKALLRNAAGTGPPLLLLEGSILGKVTFEECSTKLKGSLSAPCKPHSKGSPEGTIATELAKGLIELHAAAPEGTVFKIVPDPNEAGKVFVTLILGKEGIENECSIGEKLPVFGELALQDPAFKKDTSAEHLISEYDPLTHMWVLSLTAEHEAKIDGSAIAFLEGEHKGLKWGGLPG